MTRPDPVLLVPITVVVSTLNRTQLLSRCLDALLAGTRLPEEVVVVDQGEPGAVRHVLEGRRDRGVSFVHVLQQRRGLSASQNAGFSRASCAVVSVIDDDCVPDAHWIEVAAREHALARGSLLLTGRVLPLAAAGDHVLPLSSRVSTVKVVLARDALPWDVGTGGNFSVTRDAYLQAGGNDERLGTGSPGRAGNDLDLFHRLLADGVAAHYEPGLLVLHERGTRAEHRSRRWTYGFGVGACTAKWRRQGDPHALLILGAWLRLRLRLLLEARRPVSVMNEARVLLGTAHGLWFGWRLGAREEPDTQNNLVT